MDGEFRSLRVITLIRVINIGVTIVVLHVVRLKRVIKYVLWIGVIRLIHVIRLKRVTNRRY